MQEISENEFIHYLLCALRLRGIDRMSGDRSLLAKSCEAAFLLLLESGELELNFRIRPHRIHGDSRTVTGALAVCRIVTFEAPYYDAFRINLSEGYAQYQLRNTGFEELWRKAAQSFLEIYDSPRYGPVSR